MNHPWHAWVDQTKWSKHVDLVERLDMETIVTAHGPRIRRAMIPDAATICGMTNVSSVTWCGFSVGIDLFSLSFQ